jgi:CRISPR-associated protein Csm5
MLLELNRLGRDRTWAAREMEHSLFGRDPNHDLLRALRVADSEPLDRGQGLILGSVQVYPTARGQRKGLNLDMEMVDKGTVFRTAITIDEYLFRPDPLERLGWDVMDRRWLERIPELARNQMTTVLQSEHDFFSKRGAALAATACAKWLGLLSSLPANEFLLPLGFGTGWDSKTLGSVRLGRDARTFEELIGRYHMSKERFRRQGDPFPKSRHLFVRDGRPAEPIGWVKVRLDPASAVGGDWRVTPAPGAALGRLSAGGASGGVGHSAGPSGQQAGAPSWQSAVVDAYDPRRRKGTLVPEGQPFKLPFDGDALEGQDWIPSAGTRVLFRSAGFTVVAVKAR